MAKSRYIVSNFLMIAVLLFIGACDKENTIKMNNDSLINRDPTFDRGKFIDQSKARSADEYKYGPKIEEENVGERYEKIVNKEESFDYVDMADMEKNNFKMSINVENMDIRTFADMVSTMTNVNILVSDEVNGNVTARLKDVYWTSMLDSVLNTKKLAKHIDNKSNIIRIHDQGTVVQLEDFEQKRKESVQRAFLLQKASQPLYTEIFKLFYTKPDQVKAQIMDILSSKSAGTEGIRNINPEITIDTRKNLIVVKALKEDMDVVSKLIKELDTRTQQIFIEAFVVEVDDEFEKALGTRLGGVVNQQDFSGSGVAGTATPALTLGTADNSISNLPVDNALGGVGVLANIGNSAQLKFELTALETQGLTKVISNPKIFTLDNQEAVIFQGNEVPYETVSQDGTQIQFKEAGLKLAVTPQIIGDGNLQLNIQVNKDTVDTTKTNPPITKSEIKSNLVIKDGEIVVMGGIYTQTDIKEDDKVPGLGDIPGVGNLFKRKNKTNGRKELVIFIAPKIL